MGNARNYQLRKSRLVDDQLKSNSVTAINESKDSKNDRHNLSVSNVNNEHSKSLMKANDEFNLVDKKKEIL